MTPRGPRTPGEATGLRAPRRPRGGSAEVPARGRSPCREPPGRQRHPQSGHACPSSPPGAPVGSGRGLCGDGRHVQERGAPTMSPSLQTPPGAQTARGHKPAGDELPNEHAEVRGRSQRFGSERHACWALPGQLGRRPEGTARSRDKASDSHRALCLGCGLARMGHCRFGGTGAS